MASGHTLVKVQSGRTPGQKYQIRIFGGMAAKAGKKSRRKTLRTTGAKFRGGTLHSAKCHFGTSELCSSGA